MSAARERICEALLAIAADKGVLKTSIDEVIARAGVSRAEFDRRFSSKEECAIAVFDRSMARFRAAVMAAYESEPEWPDSLRAAAYAMADWMTQNPREVRFGSAELLWAGELAQASREALLQSFVALVDAGREVAPDPNAVPPLASEGMIGSLAEMITKQVRRGPVDPHSLVPEVMYMVVRPYLGEEEARRELTIPRPRRIGEG